MASLASLSKFRDPSEAPEQSYALPDGLPEGSILLVDQTLGNCALVHLRSREGSLAVSRPLTLRPKVPTGVKGNEATLARSVALQDMLLEVIPHEFETIDRVIHEQTPAANRAYRPESSLISAHCLRWVCTLHGLPWSVVSAQAAKAHVCGNSRATKDEAHEALAARYRGVVEGYDEHITNEHLRDALMLGLTDLKA